MDHRPDTASDSSTPDGDERLGEAIEAFLELIEQGNAPEPEAFAAGYPDLREDILAALQGLELVHGLVGQGSGSASGPGLGPGRDLESGRRIAGYRVVRELGRGGMGTVYEAVHVGLDRPVALKVLGTHAAPDSSARRRFLNEARTAAGLHHTHIVPVFDVGQAGGLCYYAMQRIEGSGLERVVRYLRRTRRPGSGPIPPGDAEPGSGRDATSGSQSSSRLSRLWIRVSEGLPWRRPRHLQVGGPGTPRGGRGVAGVLELPRLPATAPSPSPMIRPSSGGEPSTDPQRSPRPMVGTGDSTASWVGGGPKGGLVRRTGPVGPPAQAEFGDPARSLRRRRDDDAQPPFDPPRGSAYYRWVAEVGLQAAEALAHAHAHGVIHRDVKPSNLLVDAQGTVWVTDFGLARRLADPGLTHHDSLLGTPRYMSPEQARTGSIDGRTDVYSLGATLYELLTLRPPFDGASAAELVEQIGGREPLPPRLIDRRIPRDLETIVLKTLAKRPIDRYASATALAEDLARFLNREPVKARRISPIGRFWRVARRHPGITTVTTVATAAVLAIATYAYLRIYHERNELIKAQKLTDAALLAKEEEATKARAAARRERSAHALRVLMSDFPNRRATGLDLLRKAADPGKAPTGDPGSEPSASDLRDLAVEFLALRDVEPVPGFPTGPTRGIEFDTDGALLATLSDDGQEIALWNVDRRQRFETLVLGDGPKPPAGTAPATASDASGLSAVGGRREAATQSGTPASPGGGAGGSPRGEGRRPFWGWGNRLALAGHILAAVRPDGQGLRLFDVRTGSLLRDLVRDGRRLQGILASPEGGRLLTFEAVAGMGPGRGFGPSRGADPFPWSGETEVNLWDVNRLDEPIKTLVHLKPEGQRPAFVMGAFGPDGRTVALAFSRGASSVSLFSAEGGEPGETVETNAEQINSLALGANKMLAAATGSTIQLWDLDSRTFLASLSSTRGVPRLIRFNPQGTLLATAAGSNVEVWDVVSHKLLAVLPGVDAFTDLAFTPDGRTLAAGGGGRTAATSVWKVSDSAALVQLRSFEASPTSLAFAENGALAIGCANGDVSFYREGGNRCTGCPPVQADPPGRSTDRERDRFRVGLLFDAEGRLVAHDPRGLRIWQAGTPPRRALPTVRLPHTPGGSWGILSARSEDGRLIVLVRSSDVYLWRAAEPGRVQAVVPPPGTAAEEAPPTAGPAALSPRRGGPPRFGPFGRNLFAIQAAPRADRLYMLGDSGRLIIWELDPGVPEGPIPARRVDLGDRLPEENSGMALSPDGRYLALGDRSGTVTLLDTGTLSRIAMIRPADAEAEGRLGAMSFSPDGRTLAVGSPQGQVFLWSLADPRAPRLRFRLPGRRGPLASLVFDPQGHRLASCSLFEPMVEIWDLELLGRDLATIGVGG